MESTHAARENAKTKTVKAVEEVEETVEHAETALRERAAQARDIIEDLRDRAELAFHEKPYLLPVATGALGLGVGVLIGSKLTRLIAFTAAGALLSESVRGQVAKLSREFIRDLGDRLEATEGEAIEDDDAEPSVA